MKKSAVFLLVLGLLSIGIFVYMQDNTNESAAQSKVDSLTFTNTQVWEPELLFIASGTPRYADNWEKYITIPPPPKNSSVETQEELATLLSYKQLRTEEKRSEILKEVDLKTLEFNGRLLADYMNETKFPRIAKAFKPAFDDISTIVLQAKYKFNRVRPSFLEPLIEPVIPIPGHPAYPSGHSTQLHFVALFFTQLEPEKSVAFWAEADSITKNREIAGLHYLSDSEAGVLLARQFMELILQNEEFKILLEEAKKEWSSSGKSF